MGLYQRSDDRVSGLLGDFIITAHGAHNPPLAEAALKHFVANLDDPGCLPFLFAAHNWFSIMDRRPDADITDSVLDTMKGFVTPWLDSEVSKKHGYGAVIHNGRTYIYHPLAYYIVLWTKAHPGEQVDLLYEYAERAETHRDQALKLHIISTFGDFRHVFHDYPTVLRILTPYIQELPREDIGDRERQNPIWQQLVESLGGLRGLQPDFVDAFLEESGAPAELRDDIVCHSYMKTSGELYFRIWHVLADVLAYGPIEFVDQIIEILREALAARSMGRMVMIVVNRLIELAETSSDESPAHQGK